MIGLCLWFDTQSEAAAKYYVQVFSEMGRPASIGALTTYGPGGMREEGMVMTATFTLDGQEIMALNGGPEYKLSPAFSLRINCADQAEIDGFWSRLTAGGAPSRCGWLIDQFGVSWQVVPEALERMMTGGDPACAERVMRALLAMDKLDLAALERAAAGPDKPAISVASAR